MKEPTIFLMASEMKMKEMSEEKPSSVKRVMYLMMKLASVATRMKHCRQEWMPIHSRSSM